MTVADLIEELKKHPPHQPVRLKVHGVTTWADESEGGGRTVSEEGGGELNDVRFEGNHVSLEADNG